MQIAENTPMTSPLLAATEIGNGRMAMFFNDVVGHGPACEECGRRFCECATGGARAAKTSGKQNGTEKISHNELAPGMTAPMDRFNNLMNAGHPDPRMILQFLNEQLMDAKANPAGLANLGDYVSQAYALFLQTGARDYAAMLHNIFSPYIDMQTGLALAPKEPEPETTAIPQYAATPAPRGTALKGPFA